MLRKVFVLHVKPAPVFSKFDFQVLVLYPDSNKLGHRRQSKRWIFGNAAPAVHSWIEADIFDTRSELPATPEAPSAESINNLKSKWGAA